MIFLKIEDDIVADTVVVEKPKTEAVKWLRERIGGDWIAQDIDNPAGIGWKKDAETGRFIPIQPLPSFVFNREEWKWEPPIEYPADGKDYVWNEETTSWVEVVDNG